MRTDFAIFILSHGRAKQQTTLNAIQRAGYTGRYYFIVDDLDSDLALYQELYGDNVIVFDKELWAEQTDTVTSTGELRSVVFARNACYEIAERLGLKFFAEFDDDLESFSIRYEDSGSLKGRAVTRLDDVIEAMIAFQEASGAVSVGFESSGGLIGGLQGRFSRGVLNNLHQAFILRTDKRIEFKGILNENSIANEWCNTTGRLALEICQLVQSCPVRSKNTGGLRALYEANSEYVRAFYSVIAFPNVLSIAERSGNITLLRKPNSVVKIISERWKKHA